MAKNTGRRKRQRLLALFRTCQSCKLDRIQGVRGKALSGRSESHFSRSVSMALRRAVLGCFDGIGDPTLSRLGALAVSLPPARIRHPTHRRRKWSGVALVWRRTFFPWFQSPFACNHAASRHRKPRHQLALRRARLGISASPTKGSLTRLSRPGESASTSSRLPGPRRRAASSFSSIPSGRRTGSRKTNSSTGFAPA